MVGLHQRDRKEYSVVCWGIYPRIERIYWENREEKQSHLSQTWEVDRGLDAINIEGIRLEERRINKSNFERNRKHIENDTGVNRETWIQKMTLQKLTLLRLFIINKLTTFNWHNQMNLLLVPLVFLL